MDEGDFSELTMCADITFLSFKFVFDKVLTVSIYISSAVIELSIN